MQLIGDFAGGAQVPKICPRKLILLCRRCSGNHGAGAMLSNISQDTLNRLPRRTMKPKLEVRGRAHNAELRQARVSQEPGDRACSKAEGKRREPSLGLRRYGGCEGPVGHLSKGLKRLEVAPLIPDPACVKDVPRQLSALS